MAGLTTIGGKLKAARGAAGLTQEQAAEKAGVSRQTVSSWENDRSYPDIGSVIALSELYGISLDELLKEDTAMIRHLEETTNTVKGQKALARRVLIAAYLLIWAFSIGFFWVATGPTDAMGYGLVFLWLVLPAATLVISFFVGRGEEWREVRWLMLLFFGVFYMLAPYATFTWANISAFGAFRLPDPVDLLPGILCSALGMTLGTAARKWFRRREKEEKAADGTGL